MAKRTGNAGFRSCDSSVLDALDFRHLHSRQSRTDNRRRQRAARVLLRGFSFNAPLLRARARDVHGGVEGLEPGFLFWSGNSHGVLRDESHLDSILVRSRARSPPETTPLQRGSDPHPSIVTAPSLATESRAEFGIPAAGAIVH